MQVIMDTKHTPQGTWYFKCGFGDLAQNVGNDAQDQKKKSKCLVTHANDMI